MPTELEPSEATSPGLPKPFAYFLAGLAVGAVCVLLPFLCILPFVLHQARVGDQLQAQLTRKDEEITRLQQMQAQMQNRPPGPPGYSPPPRPEREPPFDAMPDAP